MEIVPGIHMIEGIIAHCYLVDDAELVLIDTGMPHKTKKIIRYITDELQRSPSDLKTIILTHCDIDHIGNALELRSLTGAKIAAHPYDAEIIAGKKMRKTPKGGMKILFKLLGSFLQVKPFPVDRLINEGDTLSGLAVLHMPGHTSGSIALYDSKRNVLFIGDTLGFRDGVVQGPSKNVTLDMEQANQSVEKLKDLNFTVMLSGHGAPVRSDASAKVQEYIAQIKNRKATR
ncbi:MAG TPA: MBL fold metallo-hydrolase [Thermoplasmata archaeon]|jgi:hydroxyacylglutathione hydrolase|nr:MAG TPA: MBL fold metallo-hydrolase [Thermoplasmata archaeon]